MASNKQFVLNYFLYMLSDNYTSTQHGYGQKEMLRERERERASERGVGSGRRLAGFVPDQQFLYLYRSRTHYMYIHTNHN